jgi:hypothetical protein
MRRLGLGVVLAVVGATCGGSSTAQDRLVGTWLATDSSGTQGVGLTLNSDETYAAQQLLLTSSTSAEDEIEGGVYTATASDITFTPQRNSCPGPDPIYTLSYQLNGTGLSIITPSGAIFLSRDNSPAPSNAALSFGCFQPDGSFMAEPIAPVSN